MPRQLWHHRFSSLYIGILAATLRLRPLLRSRLLFQFPLHRDPRCNTELYLLTLRDDVFQFPLHRDPRCNLILGGDAVFFFCFSSLYIGILAATYGIDRHAIGYR